ncbi:MAG TPA: hypothetical protein VHF47_08675 [Acidimicrobiales bacterium]|nr:hypothetical protein [Acidimicrobiales bacterium]
MSTRLTSGGDHMKVVTQLWRAFRGLSAGGQVAAGAGVGILLLAAVGASTQPASDTHVQADGPTTSAEDTSTTTTTVDTTTTESTSTTTSTTSTTTTTTTAPPATTTTAAPPTTAAPRTTTTQRPTTTTTAAATTQQPAQQQQQRDCDPSYPDVCIPSPPPDLDCPEVQYKNFRVVGSDPHGFDRDRDGIGCET